MTWRSISIAWALALVALTGPCAGADSVCDKWEFADDGGTELKKCRAAEAAGKKYIADWLAKYGVHSPLQLQLAMRDKRGFALLYEDCAPSVGDAAIDLAYVASCLKHYEDEELKAGTDLTR
jgi:hypothetical protein